MKNKTTKSYENLTFQVKYNLFHICCGEIALMKHHFRRNLVLAVGTKCSDRERFIKLSKNKEIEKIVTI